MTKTPPYIAIGLGLFATGHYVFSPYLPAAADAPDAPPLASIVSAPSSGTLTLSGLHTVVNAITDAEYPAPPDDTSTLTSKSS